MQGKIFILGGWGGSEFNGEGKKTRPRGVKGGTVSHQLAKSCNSDLAPVAITRQGIDDTVGELTDGYYPSPSKWA